MRRNFNFRREVFFFRFLLSKHEKCLIDVEDPIDVLIEKALTGLDLLTTSSLAPLHVRLPIVRHAEEMKTSPNALKMH